MKLVAERPEEGVQILRIESQAEADPWRASFAGAYQAIWSEPPYNERFYPEEAEAVLRHALDVRDNVTLLAVRDSGLVVGFAISYPLVAKADVAREVRGLLPTEDTIYFAELGVLDRWRKHGLGHQLVDLRLQLVDPARFHYVLLRTSAVRNTSYELYRRLGFDDTGVYMEVASRKVDGGTRTDRRLFLSKVV